jgi:transposase-like protein
MFTSQLIAQGTVRQRDIVQAFGVPLATVKRYMKVHREQGAAGFFRPPRRRSASVLTPEVKQRVQALLDEGKSVPEVSLAVGVASNTLHKAIRGGRLHEFKKN